MSDSWTPPESHSIEIDWAFKVWYNPDEGTQPEETFSGYGWTGVVYVDKDGLTHPVVYEGIFNVGDLDPRENTPFADDNTHQISAMWSRPSQDEGERIAILQWEGESKLSRFATPTHPFLSSSLKHILEGINRGIPPNQWFQEDQVYLVKAAEDWENVPEDWTIIFNPYE